MADLADRFFDEQLRLETSFATSLADLLAAAMDEMLMGVRQTQRVGQMPAQPRRALVGGMTSLWMQATESSAKILDNEFKDGFTFLHRKQDDTNQTIIRRYIDAYGTRNAAQVIRTTEKQVQALVQGGLRQGDAMDTVLSSIVNKIPELASQRAAVISSTEVHSSAQFASQLLAEKSLVPLVKSWSSVKDDRTRRFGFFGRQDAFNHLVMDGVKVDLNSPFRVPARVGGFESLQFPGDPAGSAGNVINCRCIQTYERVS